MTVIIISSARSHFSTGGSRGAKVGHGHVLNGSRIVWLKGIVEEYTLNEQVCCVRLLDRQFAFVTAINLSQDDS